MFCKYCGSQIDDNAVFCPHCGVSQTQNKEETNAPAIVGFVLSFFIAIAGLICSIVGYKKAKELGGKGYGFAVAGIIISIVDVWISIAIIAVVTAT